MRGLKPVSHRVSSVVRAALVVSAATCGMPGPSTVGTSRRDPPRGCRPSAPWTSPTLQTLIVGLCRAAGRHRALPPDPGARPPRHPRAGGRRRADVSAPRRRRTRRRHRDRPSPPRLRDILLLVFFVTIGLSAKLSALARRREAAGAPVRRHRAAAGRAERHRPADGAALRSASLRGPARGQHLVRRRSGHGDGLGQGGAGDGVRARPSWRWPPPRWRWSSVRWWRARSPSWLIRRRGLHGPSGDVEAPWLPPEPARAGPARRAVEKVMRALLLIFLAVAWATG